MKPSGNPPEAEVQAQKPEPTSPDSTTLESPAAVIHEYYDAINARDYRRAYALWGDLGAGSPLTYEKFAAGFADTDSVHVEIGEPGRVEGAAGSRFVDVPVIIFATTKSGEHQRFEGRYTLRRSVVDGASPAQKRWHIYSAEIRR